MKTTKTTKKKASSIRHTRAIALDRCKRPNTAPPPQAIEDLLAEIVQPAIFSLIRYYGDLGLGWRTLTLPVMVAFVLSLIWRQFGSVSQAVRVLKADGALWEPPIKVSQQAVSSRLREMPAALFERVFNEIVPVMHQRWEQRSRPMPHQLQTARRHFKGIVAVDGSVLDALIKKVGLLREVEGGVLAGKIIAVLDIASQLPVKIWYGEDSAAHDQNWWEQIIATLEVESLVLFDMGFINYARYQELTEAHKYFVTRLKSTMGYRVVEHLTNGATLREWLVQVGDNANGSGQLLRMVEVSYEGKWYSYLTNVLDTSRLTGAEIAWLYRQRWRIEDAFKTAKRLLGLAYFYSSSINAVCVQVWATWLLYCVLIDLTDGVAEELGQTFARISVEMVYRGLYHYSQALKRGEELNIFQYLARDAKDLGVLKRPKSQRINLTSLDVP